MSSKKLLSPTLCSSPGCLRFSLSKGLCSLHYYRLRDYSKLARRQRRALLLLQWMASPKFFNPEKRNSPAPPTNRRVRQGTSQPLTPLQQLRYQQYLNSFIRSRRPTSALELSHCHSLASMTARTGGPLLPGHHNNSHPANIGLRKRGWLKKWLREGTYDPDVLSGKTKLSKKRIRQLLTMS